jgi:hypothetical protein
MATQSTTLHAPTESIEPENGVSSRRLKKREIDRRCQRQARERTKSRIAYLEGLVEDFRQQDSSGQLATLMKQLKEVENERDVMAKTLKDIQKAMDTHRPLVPTAVDDGEDKMDIQNTTAGLELPNMDQPLPGISPRMDDELSVRRASTEERASSVKNFDLARFSPTPSLPLQSQDQLFAPEIVQCETGHQSSVIVKAKDLEPNPMPCSYADNWLAHRQSCSCTGHHQQRLPGQRSIWQGNYWRYANEVLSERFEWTDVSPETDTMCDDVPVRVMLEGWDAVAKKGPLHPSWHILRRIDEALFSMCPKVERLAILRAMHTLLQFHTDSTAERYARLPPWYMRRPSQKIAHSYAIDYFAWPGVRERFIFNEHDYCGNEFWMLFTTSLKILWPYEFRDCYTREIETGLYKVSPQFDERLCDIKSWTMGPDIFRRFPELYSDMPTSNSIPQTPSSVQARLLAQMHQKQIMPMALSPKSVPIGAVQAEDAEEAKPKVPKTRKAAVPRPRQQQRQRQEILPPAQVFRPQEPMQDSFILQEVDLTSSAVPEAITYGAMSESEFAMAYHNDVLNGFQHAIF